MDVIVTARVPVEIREQGNEMLEKIGATPTQLINAAYKYVLGKGQLPALDSLKTFGTKSLSEDEKTKLRQSIEATSFAVPEEYWQGKTYKEIIEHDRRADYEALS